MRERQWQTRQNGYELIASFHGDEKTRADKSYFFIFFVFFFFLFHGGKFQSPIELVETKFHEDVSRYK